MLGTAPPLGQLVLALLSELLHFLEVLAELVGGLLSPLSLVDFFLVQHVEALLVQRGELLELGFVLLFGLLCLALLPLLVLLLQPL
jgi:hypothetical protein